MYKYFSKSISGLSAEKGLSQKLFLLVVTHVVAASVTIGLWLLSVLPFVQESSLSGLFHVSFILISLTVLILLTLGLYLSFGFWAAGFFVREDFENEFLSGLTPFKTYILGWSRWLVQIFYVAAAFVPVAFIMFNIQPWQVLPNPGERTGIIERVSLITEPSNWQLKNEYLNDTTSAGDNVSWPASDTLIYNQTYAVPKGSGIVKVEEWFDDSQQWKEFGMLRNIDCDENSCDASVTLTAVSASAENRLEEKFSYRISARYAVDKYDESKDSVDLELIGIFNTK